MSISSKSTRVDELDMAVTAAVKQVVKQTDDTKTKEFNSDDEMMAQFLQTLFLNINSESDIEVKFMGVDYVNGLLDVIVTEYFTYPNGNKDKISVRKTAICG